MTDQFDIAAELEELHRQQALAQRPKVEIVPGKPGECDFCGEWFGRLVGGACGFCRDKHKLP